MYGYKETEFRLTKEDILSRVTQEDIFQMVIGYLPKQYVYVKSPFRKDSTPGCYFEWYKDVLYFIDWTVTTKRRHRDCFNAVQDILNLHFYEVLYYIDNHFKLGLTDGESLQKITVHDFKVQEPIDIEKKIVDISFKSRPFNSKKDRSFWWSRYEISKYNLIEDNIFPIIWYRIYSRKLNSYVVIRPVSRSYAIYTVDERVKIYTPDVKGKGKWITNCSANDIGGTGDSEGDLLLICKSYKDYRVLKNQGLNCRWFQNEGMYPDFEILIPIISKFNRICIFFDNDSTGVLSAKKISELINEILPNRSFPLSLPESMLEQSITDPSDLIHKKGKTHLIGFLKENKLLSESSLF